MENNISQRCPISFKSHHEDTENQNKIQIYDEQFDVDEKNTVSYFTSVKSVGAPLDLDSVLTMIKDGKCQKAIEKLHRAKDERDDVRAVKIKNKLPAFTPSGEFNKTHRKEDLIQYNPIVILDLDKVGSDLVGELKQRAKNINTTFVAFISPSGDGLKLFIKTDTTVDNHEQAFNEVAIFYEDKLGVEVDKSGKDFSRLCFLSYDPDLYQNDKAEIFKVEIEKSDPVFTDPTYSGDLTELFTCTESFTERIMEFQNGNRNNFIYLLANNLNRVGVDRQTAESMIRANYTDPDMVKEIPASINSAYTHNDEHGMWTPEYIISVSSVSSVTAVKSKYQIGTPFIPDKVYDNLPDLLKRCTQVFGVQREKDIMLTGSLTILSGCFPTVKGLYDGREYSANLFSFIIAPAASGKGILIYAKALGQTIHENLINELEDPTSEWDISMQRAHYLPADSSAAAVKGNLKLNIGIATICETEADTLSSTLQQEWGQFSDLMRKAFQHEPITFSRLGEKGMIKLEEIPFPRLSICLSGTPNQIHGLIKGIEDGMFSRIMFYSFRNVDIPAFKDVFSDTGSNLTEYFNKLSSEIYNDFYIKCKNTGTILFNFTKHQQKIFVDWFDKMVKKTHLLFGEETVPIVFRLGLITFRIAMVLSIVRKIEKDGLTETVECDNTDFETSLTLSNIYLEHALSVYQLMPRNHDINPTIITLLSFLPDSFTYNEAVKIGEATMNISEKTVYNYLIKLKEARWIKQPKKNGHYFK